MLDPTRITKPVRYSSPLEGQTSLRIRSRRLEGWSKPECNDQQFACHPLFERDPVRGIAHFVACSIPDQTRPPHRAQAFTGLFREAEREGLRPRLSRGYLKVHHVTGASLGDDSPLLSWMPSTRFAMNRSDPGRQISPMGANFDLRHGLFLLRGG